MKNKIIRKIRNKLLRYFLLLNNFFIKIPNNIVIQDPRYTIDRLISIIESRLRGGYLRFGDGDVNLMYNMDDSYQKSSKKISKEMRETFLLNDNNILKCLSLHSNKYGFSEKMEFGVFKLKDKGADFILKSTYKYFIGQQIFSPVALSYSILFDKEYALYFLQIIKKNRPIIICNKNNSIILLKKLFDFSDIIYVSEKNSYDNIDEAEKKLIKSINNSKKDYNLIIIAMGCSGRILNKRILKNKELNVFCLDFGSVLDILNGEKTRAWMNYKDLSEDYFDYFLQNI